MAGINRIAFESKLNNHIFFFNKRFVLHTQLDKRYISRYEDTEPTQHRYSAATNSISKHRWQGQEDTEK